MAYKTITRRVSKSSFIEQFKYTLKTRVLVIEFKNGSQYAYSKVPLDVFKTFLEAKSYGHFYDERIKGTFESEKVN